MIIDSGAALKFCSRPGQKSVLDKMRYNSYDVKESGGYGDEAEGL